MLYTLCMQSILRDLVGQTATVAIDYYGTTIYKTELIASVTDNLGVELVDELRGISHFWPIQSVLAVGIKS